MQVKFNNYFLPRYVTIDKWFESRNKMSNFGDKCFCDVLILSENSYDRKKKEINYF